MTICPFKQSIPTGDPIPEPARIAYAIENNSGVSLGMAIKKSGVSAGPCNHAENASGLRLFDEGLAIQLRRNNSFQIKMENSNTCGGWPRAAPVGARRARLSLAAVDDVRAGARQREDVRKEEKGIPAIFANKLTFNEGDRDERKILMHRSFTVFVVAQIEEFFKEEASEAVIPEDG